MSESLRSTKLVFHCAVGQRVDLAEGFPLTGLIFLHGEGVVNFFCEVALFVVSLALPDGLWQMSYVFAVARRVEFQPGSCGKLAEGIVEVYTTVVSLNVA